MPGLDDVLERLVTDPSFRAQLAADPARALGGYDLSADDVALLASQISETAGSSGRVESRSSKSSLAGFMGAAGDLAEAFGAGDASEQPPSMWFFAEHPEVQASAEVPGAVDPGLGDVAAVPNEPDAYMQVKLKDVLVSGVQHPTGEADAASSDGAAEPTGQDALTWDPGDGGEAPLGGEHIEIHSWASSQPAAAEPDLIEEEIGFAYKAIKFEYNEPGATSPEDLAAGGDATEETGPIADVLYSAAGNSGDSNPGTPIVGDWKGDGDGLVGDGDSDYEDFAAWREDYPEPSDPATPGELGGSGDSAAPEESISFVFEKMPITYDPAAAPDNEPGAAEDIATVDPGAERITSWELQQALISSYQTGGHGVAPDSDGVADVLVGADALDHGSASSDVADPATGGADGTVSVGGVEYYFFDNTAIAEPEAGAVSAVPEEPTASGGDDTVHEPVAAPDPEPTNEPEAAPTAEAPKAEAPKVESKQIEQPREPLVEERVEPAAEAPVAPDRHEEPAAPEDSAAEVAPGS